MEEDGDAAWAVGPGKIDVFDLVLIRLDHVSAGSWQVQLQLIRPPSPSQESDHLFFFESEVVYRKRAITHNPSTCLTSSPSLGLDAFI